MRGLAPVRRTRGARTGTVLASENYLVPSNQSGGIPSLPNVPVFSRKRQRKQAREASLRPTAIIGCNGLLASAAVSGPGRAQRT
jgi:hypothetical protein